MKHATVTACGLLVLAMLSGQGRADTAEGIEFFELCIRPVLVQHCYKCHSDREGKPAKGELRVDSREGIREGGESGHSVVPFEIEESLLLSAIRYEDFEMPPAGPLAESIVADFEAWIQMGAPDPRDTKTNGDIAPPDQVAAALSLDEGRDFWAYQPMRNSSPPVDPTGWSWTAVDNYLAAGHRRAGLVPVADADRNVLLRRVYFDLIGLPPTPDQIQAFLADSSDNAFEKVVDQLLDSPEFGQRWGRHWLDIVRFAESTGRTRNFPYPFAWRYRDYVVNAMNNDKPFDQFLREQIAGDLLPAETPEQRDEHLIATGFLTLGAYDLNERNKAVFQMDQVGDQLDVVGRAVMGLTVGCARCHDHKFDPIPTADYYAMAGIFRSTEVLNGYTNRNRNNKYDDSSLFVKLETATDVAPPVPQVDNAKNSGKAQRARVAIQRKIEEAERAEQQARMNVAQVRRQQASLKQKRSKTLRQAEKTKADVKRSVELMDERLERLAAQLDDAKLAYQQAQQKLNKTRCRQRPEPLSGPYAMGVHDRSRTADCPVHLGGDVDRLAEVVPRGFLQVVHVANSPVIEPGKGSGRRELADWLTQPDHPLTARVFVNRVWHHLFGTGIVATVDNFGQMGSRPTHPELLDQLALKFVEEGWSIKRLIRSIVLSHAYQLDNETSEVNEQLDAANRLVWRMPMRRLEAEAIRDAILQISGQLDRSPPTVSKVQSFPVGQINNGRRIEQAIEGFNYRSIYLPIIRSQLPNYLTTFDFPEPSEVKGDRDVTTVATQALFMMNSPMTQNYCAIAAQRLVSATMNQPGRMRPRQLVREAYLLTLNRLPTEPQIDRALDYGREVRREVKVKRPRVVMVQTMTDLIHALISSAEFRYR